MKNGTLLLARRLLHPVCGCLFAFPLLVNAWQEGNHWKDGTNHIYVEFKPQWAGETNLFVDVPALSNRVVNVGIISVPCSFTWPTNWPINWGDRSLAVGDWQYFSHSSGLIWKGTNYATSGYYYEQGTSGERYHFSTNGFWYPTNDYYPVWSLPMRCVMSNRYDLGDANFQHVFTFYEVTNIVSVSPLIYTGRYVVTNYPPLYPVPGCLMLNWRTLSVLGFSTTYQPAQIWLGIPELVTNVTANGVMEITATANSLGFVSTNFTANLAQLDVGTDFVGTPHVTFSFVIPTILYQDTDDTNLWRVPQ